ncbi:MAG: cytidylate kinase family protein [Candidatus Paceibacterota bacterium]
MKKEIITISGLPGSGKSSTADNVAKKLGFSRFSSGDFMRRIALEKGISLNELSKIAEQDQGQIDKEIDDSVTEMSKENKVVLDSRLAFHFIPNSFKIFLDLPPEIAKERILNNLKTNTLRAQSENATTTDEVFQKITERLESEKKRYRELYNLDYTNKENFDLVIDTNKNNLEEVVEIILKEYQAWLQS